MSSLFSDPKKPTAFSIRIEGIATDSCVERVEKAIRATPGVVSASVNLATDLFRGPGHSCRHRRDRCGRL
jgi:Heavy-metal-associated domain